MSAPYYQDDMVTLHHGDALSVARDIETASVQTIVTSPPYFGLRDYGAEGQLGAEETVGGYVADMVSLFHELRRVLADDGTLWLNLGDSYVSSPPGNKDFRSSGLNGAQSERYQETLRSGTQTKRDTTHLGIRTKNLIGVPWRVALALQADGWILRSDIIWAKPNPMPESVTDRPTKAHEYLFLLAKSPKYYYDAKSIAEDATKGDAGSSWTEGKTGEHQLGRAQVRTSVKQGEFGGKGKIPGTGQAAFRAVRETRNKRTVWDVATVPFPGSHFAVYPPELIRPCILAGSRIGGTVLDPFSGSGTTGMVATQEGRKYVGIDINSDYLDLSLKTRFVQPVLSLGSLS